MIDYPELRSEHLRGAKLYANREDLIASLSLPPSPAIAEIGVALGDFSKFLIKQLRPSVFHAFDFFLIHHDAMLWGRPTREVLDGKTHLDFYRDAMAGYPVSIHEGPSADTLKQLPDDCLDLAYIDAAHDYEGVLRDTKECVRALKRDGVLVFNDYIMHDPFIHADYGIVQVVNQLVVHEGWRVVGFALQKAMFCDIAIVRA